MVPFAPATAPSVTPPATCRSQRILPVVGPAVVADPLCSASWSSDGQSVHVAVPAAVTGTSSALTAKLLPVSDSAPAGALAPAAPPQAASRSRPAIPAAPRPTARDEYLKIISLSLLAATRRNPHTVLRNEDSQRLLTNW